MLTMIFRFEQQLTAVKERLEAAKVGSTRGLGGPGANGGFSFGGSGGRVAKPLRGGGGGEQVQTQGHGEAAPEKANNKRTSWFFSGQK